MMDLLKRALEIAEAAHRGQSRWDGSPYISHPKGVAEMARLDGHGIEVRAVALLHDVVEDSEASLDDLRAKDIPEAVVRAVDAISRRVEPSGKKEDYLAYILRVKADPLARIVKVYDISYNLADVKPKGRGQGSLRDKQLLARYILSGE
jgi:(p)ppGpp synthase/HD superfamily hydrolase